jgi:hypothetical protein
MVDLVSLLIELGLVKDERRARSMIDSGGVCIGSYFSLNSTEIQTNDDGSFRLKEPFILVWKDRKIKKKEYELDSRWFGVYNMIKVGNKELRHGVKI